MKLTTSGIAKRRVLVLAVPVLCGTCFCPAARSGGPPDLTRGERRIQSEERPGIWNLGPTGATGWIYSADFGKARQIEVLEVDKNSPADGILIEGDVILGAGGRAFDSDPRKCLARAITEAETEQGRGILKLTRWRNRNYVPPPRRLSRVQMARLREDARRAADEAEQPPLRNDALTVGEDLAFQLPAENENGAGQQSPEGSPGRIDASIEEVEVQLEVLGTYSASSPFDCPKTQKILENGWRHLTEKHNNGRLGGRLFADCLALLASGKPEHRAIVREFVHTRHEEFTRDEVPVVPGLGGRHVSWAEGFRLLFLAEYYLATGDESVLPALRATAVEVAWRQSGIFGQGRSAGNGWSSAAGGPCFLGLVLARKCRVADPKIDEAIDRSRRFFGTYVGKGAVPYDYDEPWTRSFDCSGNSVPPAIAFRLIGEQRGAKYFAKNSTAACFDLSSGHAGNYFACFWGALGSNIAGPKAVAAAMEDQRWWYELARRWDGSFVNHRPTGGLSSATGAYLLHYSVPRRAIYITGRDPDKGLWIDGAELREVIEAGRNDYVEMGTDELFDRLGVWSPCASERVAGALARKVIEGDKTIVPRLIRVLQESDDPTELVGACWVFRKFRGSNAVHTQPAVPVLIGLFKSEHENVRNAALMALAFSDVPGRTAAIEPALRAALEEYETDGFDVGTTRRTVAEALFRTGGERRYTGICPNPVQQGVDLELLTAAGKKLLWLDPGRGTAIGAYRDLPLEYVVELADEIVHAAENPEKNRNPFADAGPRAARYILAKHRTVEGLRPCRGDLECLRRYRGSARPLLPELKEWLLREPDDRMLAKTIELIENDKDPPELISLAELVEQKVIEELSRVNDPQRRIAECRRMMQERPGAAIMISVCLKQLVRMLDKDRALVELSPWVGHSSHRVRATAAELGAGLPGEDVTRWWVARLEEARGAQRAGVLGVLASRGDAGALTAVEKCLNDDEEIVRAAAVRALGLLGGERSVPLLVEFLLEAEGRTELEAAVEAIVEACRNAPDGEPSQRPVVAAFAGASETASLRLLRVCDKLGSDAALKVIAGATADDRRSVRQAAFGVLRDSTNPKATGELLRITADARDRDRYVRAFRSSVERVAGVNIPDPKEKLAVIRQLLELARTPADRSLAIGQLDKCPPREGLLLAQRWLRDKAAKEAAAEAAVAIVEGMDLTDDEQRAAALGAMKAVAESAKGETATTKAAKFVLEHGGLEPSRTPLDF